MDLVYNHMVELLKAPRFGSLREDVQFQQALVSFCNDVMKKDSTLVLCYPARTLVVAMYYMVLKTSAIRARHEVPLEQGRHWYVNEGVDTSTIEAITQRYLSKLYDTKPAAKHSGGTGAASVATAADSTVMAMPEASALCAASGADGAVSAALQNNSHSPSAAHTGSRWVASESTAGQPSAGKQAAIAAQRKIVEQDPEVGPLLKRSRLEPADNQQKYKLGQVQQQQFSMVEASDDEKEEGEI